MTPFLAEDFGDILKSFMRKIVKNSVIEEAQILSKLTKIDVSHEQKLKRNKNINRNWTEQAGKKELNVLLSLTLSGREFQSFGAIVLKLRSP